MPFSSSVRSIGSSMPLTSAFSSSPRPQRAEPFVVNRRRDLVGEAAELVAVLVAAEHGELCLRRAQRQLLALELDPRRQDRVLERVLACGQLGRDEPGLAGLA